MKFILPFLIGISTGLNAENGGGTVFMPPSNLTIIANDHVMSGSGSVLKVKPRTFKDLVNAAYDNKNIVLSRKYRSEPMHIHSIYETKLEAMLGSGEELTIRK